MRTPNRIDPFLEKLGNLWKKCPDMRFGQLVSNISHKAPLDLFYIEDSFFDVLVDEFEKSINTPTKTPPNSRESGGQ